ncbi:hypothetical protein SLS56_010493 [Neofusicoccum ribis]|uniref:Cytochrome P450 n=1 Tax=Neofusicoccum ribis TaxID=45134 RepID=A0ABR3SFN1_9PEZI
MFTVTSPALLLAIVATPQPPGHELIWGHCKLMGELTQKLPARAHPQIYGEILHQDNNLGKAFYVDLWPFSDPMLIIRDPELADQVAVKPSMQKAPMLKTAVRPYIGVNNLVVQEGDEWKKWRNAFNSAFSAAALQRHVPELLEECQKFCRRLDTHARDERCFEMEPALSDLTIDIIGRFVLGSSFTSSPDGRNYSKTLRDQAHRVAVASDPGFAQLKRLNPVRFLAMRHNEQSMDRAIMRVVSERWEQTKQTAESKHAIDLALSSYASGGLGATSSPGSDDLDKAFLRVLVDQIKTFIFAGHDTSSGTLCYIFWLLKRNPTWLKRVQEEYAQALPNASDVSEEITARPNILNELPLTTAVIKETLRLFPPASSIRTGTAQTPIIDAETGETYPTEGFMVMNATFSLHRNPAYFPDPHNFRPERWLTAEYNGLDCEILPPPRKTHTHAWRPFEAGPRSCLGQKLAMMEIKMIMILVLSQFDIEPGYQCEGKKEFEYLGGPAYPILFGTAKPNGGMPVRVARRSTR